MRPKARPFDIAARRPAAAWNMWAAATSTYQVITITGDTLAYKAVVSHRGAGSTSPFSPGGVLDQFEIVKSAAGGKVVR